MAGKATKATAKTTTNSDAKGTTDVEFSDEPTSSQFHGELQNTSAENFSGGNTTAPTYNDVPQGPGFDAKAAKADEQ